MRRRTEADEQEDEFTDYVKPEEIAEVLERRLRYCKPETINIQITSETARHLVYSLKKSPIIICPYCGKRAN